MATPNTRQLVLQDQQTRRYVFGLLTAPLILLTAVGMAIAL